MAHEDLAARVAQALPSLRHFGHQPESAAWGSRLVEDIGILLAAYDAQARELAALRAQLREAEGRAWYEVDDG